MPTTVKVLRPGHVIPGKIYRWNDEIWAVDDRGNIGKTVTRPIFPEHGTKGRIVFDLIARPDGATLRELNHATDWEAITYVNDTRRLAYGCGGVPKWTGGSGSRRFWIEGGERPE